MLPRRRFFFASTLIQKKMTPISSHENATNKRMTLKNTEDEKLPMKKLIAEKAMHNKPE
jgi:hypothetical protein